MWRAKAPDPVLVKLFTKAREKYDLAPLVIHDSYLINLASVTPALHAQSVDAFRGELERAIAIGADYLVMHPGNCKGHTCEEGILNIVKGIALAASGLKSKKLEILLENTAGAGNSIGVKFEELALIRKLAEKFVPFPVNYCLDTCHCYSSGLYDVSTEAGLKHTVEQAKSILGLDNVKVIHCNDSKGAHGSHVDRHQHIGKGYIGLEGFRRILNHPKLRSKAFILETPVDEEGDERRNLDTLKDLCRKSSSTTKKLS